MNIKDLKQGSYEEITSPKLNIKNLPQGSYEEVSPQDNFFQFSPEAEKPQSVFKRFEEAIPIWKVQPEELEATKPNIFKSAVRPAVNLLPSSLKAAARAAQVPGELYETAKEGALGKFPEALLEETIAKPLSAAQKFIKSPLETAGEAAKSIYTMSQEEPAVIPIMAEGAVKTGQTVFGRKPTGIIEPIAKPVIEETGAIKRDIGKTIYPYIPRVKSPETAANIMQRVSRISKGKQSEFKQITGEDVGEYRVNRGMFESNPEKFAEQLRDRFQKSRDMADTGLSALKGSFKTAALKSMAEELLQREIKVSSPGALSADLKTVINLKNKLNKQGLEMKEINQLKRIYERNVKLEYLKERNSTGIAKSTSLDKAVRKWQFEKADKMGFKNLNEINKETQAAKKLYDYLVEENSGVKGNNAIGLGDLILISGGDIRALALTLTRKIFGTKFIQSKIAKSLAGEAKPEVKIKFGTPRGDISDFIAGRAKPATPQLPDNPTNQLQQSYNTNISKMTGKVKPKIFESKLFNLKNRAGLSIEDISKKPFEGYKDLTTKFLDYAKGKTTLSKQEILNFARRPELKKGEADLLNRLGNEIKDTKVPAQEFANSIKQELLPLKMTKVKPNYYTSFSESGYPNVPASYPFQNIRIKEGNPKNYEEVVFESPIETNGSSHYPNSKNYFAHARGDEVVEGGKKVWREQEIQSDFVRSDRLENAQGVFKGADTPEKALNILNKNPKSEVLRDAYNRQLGILKLKPFENDRFGERIMRERIKQKAQQGYSSYRIPTGETIGKIEGFDIGNWATLPEEGGFGARLKPDDLKIGQAIQHNNDTKWIITDILGDGRFKAVPKQQYNLLQQKVETSVGSQYQKFSKPEDYFAFARKEGFDFDQAKETFDLTGKSNPQYRRYENWGKFLKNKYGGKEITDPQGNSWIEIPLKKEYSRMPIEAFSLTPLAFTPKRKQKQ